MGIRSVCSLFAELIWFRRIGLQQEDLGTNDSEMNIIFSTNSTIDSTKNLNKNKSLNSNILSILKSNEEKETVISKF